MTYIKAHQTITQMCATHEAKKERKPKQIDVNPGWWFKPVTFRSLFLSEAKEGQIVGAAQNLFHYL